MHVLLQNLMNRALLLPVEPLHNARPMKLTEAFQASQRITNLVLFHADRALLRTAILPHAIFLRRHKGEHPSPLCRRLGRDAATRQLTMPMNMPLDASTNMCLTRSFAPISGP